MPPELTDVAWVQIRYDYEHTETPVEDICIAHGVSPGTLRDRMRRWKWTRRRQPIPPDGPPPAPAPQIEAAPPVAPVAQAETAAPAKPPTPQAPPRDDSARPDPDAIVQRLQVALGSVLPAIETTLARLAAGATHPREMERAARAIAALTRTLRELNELLKQQQAAAEEELNLDKVRAEIARKIEGIVARRPKRAAAEPEDSGSGSAAN